MLEERVVGDVEIVPVLDGWRFGYYLGIRQGLAAWAPLLMAHPSWFSTILRYGTEDGWELLRRQPITAAEQRTAAEALGMQARAIYAHWLAERRPSATEVPGPLRRAGPKLGRNDPCHCGSGRKYKHCNGGN